MKKTIIILKKITLVILVLFTLAYCKKDFNDNANGKMNEAFHRNSLEPLMKISYVITTSRQFKSDKTTLSDLDLAAINPSNEKQNISIKLFEDGHIDMTIEAVDFVQKINIPDQTLPDTSPKITKTIISGNYAEFYDKKGKLLSSVDVPIPNQMKLVHKIKEIGKNVSAKDIDNVIATMQGYQFVDNLEEFIRNASANNIQITDRGDGLVTARMSMSIIDPGMRENIVLLIDRNINRLVGTRIYGTDNKLLKSVVFAYNKGKIKSLKAIRTIEVIGLPSGNETKMITLSKIENLKFNLNI